MEKLDLKKTLKTYYQPGLREPEMVDVPPFQFLMIDGAGDPNSTPDYSAAVSTLYGLAYTIKFMIKKGPSGLDFSVMPLEGLWWAEDMDVFTAGDKSAWQWTMMIAQPDMVTAQIYAQAVEEMRRKKGLGELHRVRLEIYHEGLSAQIMHIGSYSAEGPNIQRLHQFIAKQGCQLRGKHHEIYLGDPNRTAPEKLKTILRQPAQRN